MGHNLDSFGRPQNFTLQAAFGPRATGYTLVSYNIKKRLTRPSTLQTQLIRAFQSLVWLTDNLQNQFATG